MNNTVEVIHNPKPEQLFKLKLKPYQRCLLMAIHKNKALHQTYYSYVISEYGDTRHENLKRIAVPEEEYYKELPVFEYGKNQFLVCFSKNLEN